MMKISGYCQCEKQKMEGVSYSRYGFDRYQDILVCKNCGLAVHCCNFCSTPAYGVLSGGYACLEHIHVYVQQVHEWQEKIGVEKTRFAWEK